MRAFWACVFAGAIFSTSAFAADTGVPPRPASTDYSARGPAEAATIAAALVPATQVRKMFSAEISKQYVVVEVAIYPQGGVPFDVESSDFALRVGQKVGRADRPLDVAPWPERRDAGRHLPVDVTVESGVIYERGNDPEYGRRQGVGTYTAVGIETAGQGTTPPPPPDPGVDPRIVYDRIQRKALPEGDTRKVVAGYLYFPQYTKRKRTDAMELKYARDDVAVNLNLGKP